MFTFTAAACLQWDCFKSQPTKTYNFIGFREVKEKTRKQRWYPELPVTPQSHVF